jgi:hypothetical protein
MRIDGPLFHLRGWFTNQGGLKPELTEAEAEVLRITGYWPEQRVRPEATPLGVTLEAAPWLAAFRKNRRVLQHLGNLIPLASLSIGKAVDRWALCLGLGLGQLMRERARSLKWGRSGSGDEKLKRLRGCVATRRKVLQMFPPDDDVWELLGGDHPSRARDYWESAVELLKRRDLQLLDGVRSMEIVREVRQGWQKPWLEEELEFLPGKAFASSLDEVRTAKRQRSRRHPT